MLPQGDPRVLLTVRATGKKAERIVDYLPLRVRERIQRRKRERLVLSQAEDGTITFRPGEDECYGLSMQEWGAANMRLLSQLLRKGDLPLTDVELYLAYTMIVFELADRYEWSSIMDYDVKYREMQAQHQFKWGDMSAFNQPHILVPKRPQLHAAASGYSGHNAAKKPAATRQEDCKKWLISGGTYCPFRKKCKYSHPKVPTATDTAAKND